MTIGKSNLQIFKIIKQNVLAFGFGFLKYFGTGQAFIEREHLLAGEKDKKLFKCFCICSLGSFCCQIFTKNVRLQHLRHIFICLEVNSSKVFEIVKSLSRDIFWNILEFVLRYQVTNSAWQIKFTIFYHSWNEFAQIVCTRVRIICQQMGSVNRKVRSIQKKCNEKWHFST